jgi:hypothetical protein
MLARAAFRIDPLESARIDLFLSLGPIPLGADADERTASDERFYVGQGSRVVRLGHGMLLVGGAR